MADQEWRAFDKLMFEALQRIAKGEAAPFKELWSHSEDVSILGAFGGVARGWTEVGPRLDWAVAQFSRDDWSRERLTEYVGSDFTYTVDYERSSGGPGIVLRVTHIYRREDGKWRIFHRHADPLVETRTQAETLTGSQRGSRRFGGRKLVGGQEDTMRENAVELSPRKEAAGANQDLSPRARRLEEEPN